MHEWSNPLVIFTRGWDAPPVTRPEREQSYLSIFELIARISQGESSSFHDISSLTPALCPSMLDIRLTRSVSDGSAKQCRRPFLCDCRRLVENVRNELRVAARCTYLRRPISLSCPHNLVRPAGRARHLHPVIHARPPANPGPCVIILVCALRYRTRSRGGRRLAARRGGALHFRRSVLNAPLRVCA